VAVTFVDWDDLHRWALINKALDLGIPEPQETYSSSDHLYSDLDIPVEAKGYLRKSEQTRAGLDAEEIEDLGETGKRHAKGGRGREQHPGRARDAARDEQGETEASPRRQRNRRRTRGAGAAVAGSGAAPTASGDETGTHSSDESGGSDDGTRRPRRRRRRGGAGRESAPANAE
jgi:hypothetical protein